MPAPHAVVRAGLSEAWRLNPVPADAWLLHLALQLPLLDTTRIRTETGWSPTVSSVEALCEVFAGMADHAGAQTPPLAPDSLRSRLHEITTGVGERSSGAVA